MIEGRGRLGVAAGLHQGDAEGQGLQAQGRGPIQQDAAGDRQGLDVAAALGLGEGLVEGLAILGQKGFPTGCVRFGVGLEFGVEGGKAGIAGEPPGLLLMQGRGPPHWPNRSPAPSIGSRSTVA